jgi:sarcosine oxidase delta subunit
MNTMNAEKLQAIFDAKGRAFGSRPGKTDDQNGEDWWDYVADLGVKILVKDEVHSVRRPEELKSLINGKANGKWVYVDDCDNFLLVDRGFAEKVLVLGLP